jgi:integrase
MAERGSRGVNSPPIPPSFSMKVTIEAFRGKLRLRFDDGKRQCISLGVTDSPIGRSQALRKKAQIELDWQLGAEHYDQTLLKYKPRTLGKAATEISAPELFDRFTKHQAKAKGLAPSSIKNRYQSIASALKKYLDKPAHQVGKHDAESFAAECEARKLSGRTIKEQLWLLESAWAWGVGRYHLSPNNPWVGMADRFKPSPKQAVKPFTIEELQAILAAFASHTKYRHYSDFVSFLANTGCRFGEAAGLRWKHLGANYTTTWIGESCSRGVRRSTKTGKARTVLLSPSTQKMLAARFEAMQPKADDLVFPGSKGGAIDDQNFRPRAWKRILVGCSIEYRRPYALRHSAISHALANGANPIAIAEQTGHSVKVLYETYAHVIAKEYLFVEV